MWEYNSTIKLVQQECYWWEEREAMYSGPSDSFQPSVCNCRNNFLLCKHF